MSNPLVSIILPTRNRADLLLESIESVKHQTYENWELIVIDDGSTDDTSKILNNIDDKRIKTITQRQRGRSHARNIGLRSALGSLITFLDSDDIYLNDKLKIQVDFFQNNDSLSVVYTSAGCFSGKNYDEIIMVYNANQRGWIYDQIAMYVPHTICLPTVMFRKEILDNIGLFDENLDRFEDIDYWRRIAKTYQFGAIESITCHIRTHGGNHISNLNLQILSSQVIKYSIKVIKEDLTVYRTKIKQRLIEFISHYLYAISNTKGGLIPSLSLLFAFARMDKFYKLGSCNPPRIFALMKTIVYNFIRRKYSDLVKMQTRKSKGL